MSDNFCMKHHKILRNFGERIKTIREEKDWSQETLGKKAGLHRTYIGSIERYERNISLLNIERLAKAFKVKVKDLL